MNGSNLLAANITMDAKKGQIGLMNLGNTCYLNAILQCMRHVPDLTVFLQKHSDTWIHKDNSKETALCNAYKTLTEDMWGATAPACLRPAGFIHFFRKALEGTMFDHMLIPMQHDGHEALVFLIDQLHEAMKRPLNVNVVAPEDSPVHAALTAWKSSVAPNYSPIVDYFWGLMQVTVVCQGCQTKSCRYEPFSELNVEFPDKKSATLTECMDHQFQGEAIDEYSCEKCSPEPPKGSGQERPKRHPGTIYRKIWKLPQNFIVTLKRFNANGSKCNANFATDVVVKFEKWFADDTPEKSKVADYSLHSIVNHHGSSGGGHYNAEVKSPTSGEWLVYDDETVGRLPDTTKPHFGPMNYILFFRRD